MSEPTKKSWYVVHTHSGFEAKARLGLIETARQRGCEALLGEIIIPMENVVEVKKGEKAERARKFFPGYILVELELTPETWYVVKNAPRVIGFIGGTTPQPVPAHEVARIKGQMEEGLKAPKAAISFRVGDAIKVIDGPFKNFSGTVEEVNPDKEKVRVLVSIFGRATPVELDFVQVEPIAA
ncbi:MAG: transcription termination/antitermination protein NusG [Myxococcales bacterium]|nr:transcription termination/antitermination protein NusG [Myxococcales bacterium]MCB9520648.1 transcription termination/antitermination protein NusG [Myxococcales bacterium]